MEKKYRLERPLRAVYSENGEKGFVLLPEGTVLTISGHHDNGRIAQVIWNKRGLLVFMQDLVDRGTEIGTLSRSKMQGNG